MKFFLTLVTLISTLFAFNINISDSTVANGKTSIIEFEKEQNREYEKIEFAKKTH